MARQHASPDDFALVDMDKDPTPGDVDLIRGVITRYQDVGDAAEKALNVVKKDGGISQGRGSAMDKLKEKIGDDLPDKLTKTKTSYHDAAEAYTTYIPRLQEAQDTFDRAVEQARAAAPKANQAPKTLGESPSEVDKAAAKSTQDDIAAGQAEMNAAKSLAQQAKTMREQAQRSCADTLDRAASEAIPERNIFQKISDFFKDFPFVQILLGLLIAAVAVFFPVAAALLGGALFLVTQAAAIGSGNFSLGDFVVGLVGIIPGGALIKAGGGVVTKLAPALAKGLKGSGIVKGVGGTINGIKTSIQNSKIVGPVITSQAGKVAGAGIGKFAEGAGEEAATQALNGDGLDAKGILIGGALGAGAAGAGAAFKFGKGKTGGATSASPGGGGSRTIPAGSGNSGPPAQTTSRGGPDGTPPSSPSGSGSAAEPPPAAGDHGLPPGTITSDGPPPVPTATQLPSAQVDPSVNHADIHGLPQGHDPVIRDTNEPLLRNDRRHPLGPNGVFATGLRPANPGNLNIGAASEHSIPSGFVSTSTKPNLRFGDTAGGGFKFTVHAPGGIDVNKSFGDHIALRGFGTESEIAFPGGIRTENIAGAQALNPDGTTSGPFINNPNFDPTAPNDAVPGQLPHNPAPPPPAPVDNTPAPPPPRLTNPDGTPIKTRRRR